MFKMSSASQHEAHIAQAQLLRPSTQTGYSGPTHQKQKISTLPDPTQPNPTQPMGQPNPWTTLLWPHESTSQTASRLVHQFCRAYTRDQQTDRQTENLHTLTDHAYCLS